MDAFKDGERPDPRHLHFGSDGKVYLGGWHPGRDGKLVWVRVELDVTAIMRWSGRAAKNKSGRSVGMGGWVKAVVRP